MLILVATPIGNLEDISQRALTTLQTVDYILAEDTRHSKILLDRFEIKTPLRSYHKFNEAKTEDAIIDDLKNGKTIALISDAGTPGIADPGERLVKTCRAHDIPVSGIPGACAAILALSCSGFSTTTFQFVGFLPKTKDHLTQTLEAALDYAGTTICYESPHRLLDVLQVLHILDPKRILGVAREMTKKFEEMKQGTASELLSYWETNILKGECILLISAKEEEEPQEIAAPETLKRLVEFLIDNNQLSQRDAVAAASRLCGIPKQKLYRALF